MTIIRRPTPLGELIALRNTTDRLFGDSFGRPHTTRLTATPSIAVDVHSSAEATKPRRKAQAEPGTEQGS